jgi:glucan-binding YG repeat protein
MYEATTRSRNHYFLGTYDEWFFKSIAGIQDMKNGYQTVTIKPNLCGELEYANTSVDTPRGVLQNNWTKNDNGTASFDIKIPVGTTATILFPTENKDLVTIGGQKVTTSMPGIKSIAEENNLVKVTVGSGSYSFLSATDKVTLYRIGLTASIDKASGLSYTDYTSAAWKTFSEVLNRAKSIMNSSSSIQAQVDNMSTELEEAIVELKLHPNTYRGALSELIKQAEEINVYKKQYAASIYNSFAKVLADVKKTEQKSNATDQELTAAKATLQTELDKLASYRLGNIALSKSVTASSYKNSSSWLPKNVNDGDRKNIGDAGGYFGWSSDSQINEDHEEWIAIDLGIKSRFDSMTIYPSSSTPTQKNNCYGFPKDFEIQVSDDGVNWKTVYSKANYPVPSYEALTFTFGMTYSRYVKFVAKSLRQNPADGNAYHVQLAEIEVYNSTIIDGWTVKDSKEYYYDKGVKFTNTWIETNGKKYYVDASGAKKINSWTKINNKWYYFGSSGAMTTDWVKISGKWYYFDSSGVMKTGWTKISGKWYYMNSSGAMATGWMKVSGKWYYMNSSGVMATSWTKVSGKWYFMNSSGVMQTGWKKISGKWYCFDGSGKMLENTSKKIGKKTYKFNKSGVCTNP